LSQPGPVFEGGDCFPDTPALAGGARENRRDMLRRCAAYRNDIWSRRGHNEGEARRLERTLHPQRQAGALRGASLPDKNRHPVQEVHPPGRDGGKQSDTGWKGEARRLEGIVSSPLGGSSQ